MTFKLTLTNELKHLFKRLAEHMSDPECDLEGWGVFTAFDRVDRLSRDADLVGELLLRHSAVMEPQVPDLVVDSHPRPNHG